MARNLFWLIVSFAIIVCGTDIRSEASEITPQSGSSLAKKAGNGQTGSSGGSSSCRGQSRSGASESSRQRIPKPEEDRRGKRKGKTPKCNVKRKRKRKKKGGKKSSDKKRCKHKIRSLTIVDKEGISKKKKRGGPKLKVRSERSDDIPLLLGIMKLMGMDRVIDNHIPAHWKQRDLSWGKTCIIWLAYILSEGDHRKVSVREYVRNMRITLSEIMGREIDELDFTDDRCSILLKHLSDRTYQVEIEKVLSERTIDAYKLPKDTVRCDATTLSGYHRIKEGGLFQRGVSKDDPNRPQIKIMSAALDPLGMPLASDAVSGERADDVLYRPLIKRMNAYLGNDSV